MAALGSLRYVFISCFLLVIHFLCTKCGPHQAPAYTINLDLPPEERWLSVSKTYSKDVSRIVAGIHKKIPPSVLPLAQLLVLLMEKHFPEPYPAEIKGVAKGLGLNVLDALLLNLMYDLTAYCTSIVAEDSQGHIFHGRNLDYDFPDTLRNITFISNFKSKGKMLYSGVSFAGQVGLLTAQRPNAVTVTLDERDRGFLWENVIEAILNKNARPITFLIRDVVSTEGMTFSQAVKTLSTIPLMADGYLIVGGVNSGEGAVITRERQTVADVWSLDKQKKRWYLVETNYDHWTTPPPSDDRRDPAIKALNNTTQNKLDGVSLFNVFSIHPVLNNRTVYTTIMEASNPRLTNTWIRRP